MQRIILIGGAPTTGKSTIAMRLSEELHLPVISTDQIRTIIQSIADPHIHPNLFLPV